MTNSRTIAPLSGNSASLFAAALTISLLGSGVSAQRSDVTIPAIAESHEGNDIAQYPFGWSHFRTQQLISAQAVAPTGAFISALQFRPDTSNSSGSASVTLSDVLIMMGHTSQTVTQMGTAFDQNYAGQLQQVYRGPVTLPAWSSQSGDVAPWFTIPLQSPFTFDPQVGNLLIDIQSADVTGVASRTGWVPDSALPGGALLGYGDDPAVSGVFDGARVSAYASGPSGRYSGLVPGNPVQIQVSSQFTPWSGHLLFGFDRLTQGADLGAIGAAGHLYIQPAGALPFTLQPPPIGFNYQANWTLQIPNDPAAVGASLHLQPLVLDSAGGSLGMVAFRAHELVVGDNGQHPVRQLNTRDLGSPTGTFNYTSGIEGGAVIRLLGAFN